jgi:hypothetical protein
MMTNPLPSPDASVLDELCRLEEKRRALAQRLERLLEQAGEISVVVYRRVREDYQAQQARLDEEVAALRDRVRRAEADAAVERAREAMAEIEYETEEVELRRSLGEFDQAESDRRLAQLGDARAQRAAELAAAEEAVRSLDAAVGEDEEKPASQPTAPEAGAGEEAPEPEPGPEPPTVAGATVFLPSSGIAPEQLGGTRLLRFAALVLEDPPTGGQSEFRVGPLATIGRTSKNSIQLDDASISRRHAEISQGTEGYLLRDLDSQNGTFVNGDRITERVLADGDRVLFGTVLLRFHAPGG